MSIVSKYHRTDGYTISDPMDDFYQKDFTPKVKPIPKPKILPETINIKLTLDPLAVNINRESLVSIISNDIIEYLLAIGWSQAAISRAINVSDRTIRNRMHKIDAAQS